MLVCLYVPHANSKELIRTNFVNMFLASRRQTLQGGGGGGKTRLPLLWARVKHENTAAITFFFGIGEINSTSPDVVSYNFYRHGRGWKAAT